MKPTMRIDPNPRVIGIVGMIMVYGTILLKGKICSRRSKRRVEYITPNSSPAVSEIMMTTMDSVKINMVTSLLVAPRARITAYSTFF